MDDEAASLGPLMDNFSFKKRPDGTFEKTTVVCKLCKKAFAYHRSYSSLKYHLNAKHVAASTADPTANFSVPSSSTNNCSSQPTLDQVTGFRANIKVSPDESLNSSADLSSCDSDDTVILPPNKWQREDCEAEHLSD
ncbi:hypothetical protein SRHO_G00131770 [Serrasalmus rhombeus]